MTDPMPAPGLNTNADATKDEFASVTVVLNHLAEREDGHTVLSLVFSTQTASESLLAQMGYFDLLGALGNPKVADVISTANRSASVLVLTVPEHGPHRGQTNAIVDAAIWTGLCAGNTMNPDGTVLGACAAVIALVTDLKGAASEQAPNDIVIGWVSNDEPVGDEVHKAA